MKNIRKSFAFLLCLAMVLALGGCDNRGIREQRPQYTEELSDGNVSGVIAENANFLFELDSSGEVLSLTDKNTGNSWSSALSAESFTSEFESQQIVESTLVIQYAEQLTLNVNTAYSSDSETCKKQIKLIDNGVQIDYCFSEAKITVPVKYILRDNGFAASIDFNEIAEGGSFLLYKISIAPMTARVLNNSSDSYLFIPSGSGGISYTSNSTLRSSTQEVYGDDFSQYVYRFNTKENYYLPVFGAKYNDTAIFGIIEEGSESAEIASSVNDTAISYSVIYPSFYVRKSELLTKSRGSSASDQSSLYDEDLADNAVTVGYYPLQGESADYSGMAQTYKQFLKEKYGDIQKDENASAVAIKILGGVAQKKFAFGIPYYTTFALTTIDDAEKIIDDIAQKTGINPLIQLVGFGKKGLDNYKVAGGFDIDSKLGSFKEFLNWQNSYGASNGILALDFDIVYFSKSSNGFSINSDITKSVSGNAVKQYYYHVALLDQNKSLKGFNLLSRAKLNQAADKVLELANKKEISAVSLATIGNTSYSDYANRKYYAKSNMSEQVTEILSNFRSAGKTIVSNASFEYAAMMSDYIIDAPIQSTKNSIIDEDIPFYQMVFSNRAPVYNISVNLSTSDDLAFLKAIESGAGLSYTVCENYDSDLLESGQSMLYASKYSGVSERISEQVNDYKEFYEKIRGSQITEHTILENGLRKVTYDNGLTVFVNYSDNELSYDGLSVAGNGYLIKEG